MLLVGHHIQDNKMNQHKRKVYLRKKEKKFIFECKSKGKTKYLWTIPMPYDSFLKELCKSSFLPKDKALKIMTLLSSADYVDVFPHKQPSEVRTTDTTRSFEEDDNYDLDDEIKELSNREGGKS